MIGLGIVLAFVLAVALLRGGGALALLDAHALMIVLGGSLAAAAVAFTPQALLRLPRLLWIAALGQMLDQQTVVAQLIKAGERVRAGGRAAALGNGKETNDPLLRSGLECIAQGFAPTQIRDLLEAEIAAIRDRHRRAIALFDGLGGYAPTFGILGTVEAMIAILGNLSKPEALGPEIALAMVATLYGVGFANLLFLPVATRLKKLSEEELRIRQLMVDVVVHIQEGAQPEFIRERLKLSLPPDLRRTIVALSMKKQRSAAKTAPLPAME